MDNSSDDAKSFLKHVFNFDEESKSEILNILQYAIIALIPLVLLNKSIANYVPEADDKKGSVELSAEIIFQIIAMLLGLFIIHRIITFVPTYSGEKYPEFHIVFIVLAVLMITLSLQTKLGEKVSILADRVMETWNGSGSKKQTKQNNNGTVKVSQPISGQTSSSSSSSSSSQQQSQQAYTDGTSINSLPISNSPNFDAMYRQDTNPLVNASSPVQTEAFSNEPMAANSVLGGSGGFSSW